MIKFVRTHKYAQIPQYQSEQAVGFDFHSCEEVFIPSYSFGIIPFGLACEWEGDFELQIRGRSSNYRRGIIIPHGVGTVDPDYRGDLSLPVYNGNNSPLFIGIGERVAQGILVPTYRTEIIEVEEGELSETIRGSGGFGSTGRH